MSWHVPNATAAVCFPQRSPKGIYDSSFTDSFATHMIKMLEISLTVYVVPKNNRMDCIVQPICDK